MKSRFKFLAIPMLLTIAMGCNGQANKEQILELRNSSNQAFQEYDLEKILSFLTDDVLITAGNGALIVGKESLREYLLKAGESKTYFVRSPSDIKVNETRGLAWETGTWKGYDPEKSNDPIVSGNYSAMWTNQDGKWLIKSQLFVTLN